MEPLMTESTPRIDQWLWSVRITKTRADAAELCRSGRVKVNGKIVKPSAKLIVGDRIETRVHERERIVVITKLISKRVGAALATECFDDHSPPPPERLLAPPVFERDRGAGRPTKRDRRKLDELRGRSGRPR
jgi:ribosome-associated heat shock protein Hsp15